jgi:hypothetical protein
MGVAPKASGSKLFDALDKTFASDPRSPSPNGDANTDTDEDMDATKPAVMLGPVRRDRVERLDALRAAQEQQQASQSNSERSEVASRAETQRLDSIWTERGIGGACSWGRLSSTL